MHRNTQALIAGFKNGGMISTPRTVNWQNGAKVLRRQPGKTDRAARKSDPSPHRDVTYRGARKVVAELR